MMPPPQDIANVLQHYHLYHSARAGLHHRSGNLDAARTAYRQALRLAQNDVECAFLRRRFKEV